MDKNFGILIICAAILVLSFVGTSSARTWYVDDSGGAMTAAGQISQGYKKR
jgi:hypothetical protein